MIKNPRHDATSVAKYMASSPRRMTIKRQEVYLLYWVQMLSPRQIGMMLKIPEITAYRRIQRLRRAVKRSSHYSLLRHQPP